MIDFWGENKTLFVLLPLTQSVFLEERLVQEDELQLWVLYKELKKRL